MHGKERNRKKKAWEGKEQRVLIRKKKEKGKKCLSSEDLRQVEGRLTGLISEVLREMRVEIKGRNGEVRNAKGGWQSDVGRRDGQRRACKTKRLPPPLPEIPNVPPRKRQSGSLPSVRFLLYMFPFSSLFPSFLSLSPATSITFFFHRFPRFSNLQPFSLLTLNR